MALTFGDSQSLTSEAKMLPAFTAASKNEVATGKVGSFHESFQVQRCDEREHRRRKSTTVVELAQKSAKSKISDGKRGPYFPPNTPRSPMKNATGIDKVSSRGTPFGDEKPKTRKERKDAPARLMDDSEYSAASMKERTKNAPSSGKIRTVKGFPRTESRRSSKTVVESYKTSMADESLQEETSPKNEKRDRSRERKNASNVRDGTDQVLTGNTKQIIGGINSHGIKENTSKTVPPIPHRPIRDVSSSGKERRSSSTREKAKDGTSNRTISDGAAKGYKSSPSSRKSIRSTRKGSDSPAPKIIGGSGGTPSSTRSAKGKQSPLPELPMNDSDNQFRVTGNGGLPSKTSVIPSLSSRSSFRSDSNPKLSSNSPSSRTRIRSSTHKNSSVPKISVVDDTNRVDRSFFPEHQPSSSIRGESKKTADSSRSLKPPTSPGMYFPKNVPRQRRRWSAENKETEKNDADNLGRRQTSIDAIASPPSSRTLDKSGHRKSNSRSGIATGNSSKNSIEKIPSSGGPRRSTQHGGNIFPAKVPFHDSSTTDFDLEVSRGGVSATFPPAQPSGKEKRRKSSKTVGESKQREGCHDKSRSRSPRDRRRSGSRSASTSRHRSLSKLRSHSKDCQRPQRVSDGSAQLGKNQADANTENQDDENGSTTPKASRRIMLTMERLFGKPAAHRGKEGSAECDSKNAPTALPNTQGSEAQTQRSSISRIEKWKEKAKSSLDPAKKSDDRERRRDSRRRLLESRAQTTESSAKVIPPDIQIDERTDIPAEKEDVILHPNSSGTDEDSDESISGLATLEKGFFAAGKPSAAVKSNSLSTVLNPQERRRRRATLGHDFLQRSLTAFESSSHLASSLHSTDTTRANNKSLLNMKGKKKEDVWQIRRRRHSSGKEDA